MGKSHQTLEPTAQAAAAPALTTGPPTYQQPAGNAARQAQIQAAKPDLSVQPADVNAGLQSASGTPAWAGAMPANLCHSVPDATKPISPTNCAPAPKSSAAADSGLGRYVQSSVQKGGLSVPGTPLAVVPDMDGFMPKGATVKMKH